MIEGKAGISKQQNGPPVCPPSFFECCTSLHKHGAPTPPSPSLSCPSCHIISYGHSPSSTSQSCPSMRPTAAEAAAAGATALGPCIPVSPCPGTTATAFGTSSSRSGAEPNDLRNLGGGTDWAAKIKRYGCHPSQVEGVCEEEAWRNSERRTVGEGEGIAGSTEREDGQRVQRSGSEHGGRCVDGCSALPCCHAALSRSAMLDRPRTCHRVGFGEDAETGMESRCIPFGESSEVLAVGIAATNWRGLLDLDSCLAHPSCQASTYVLPHARSRRLFFVDDAWRPRAGTSGQMGSLQICRHHQHSMPTARTCCRTCWCQPAWSGALPNALMSPRLTCELLAFNLTVDLLHKDQPTLHPP